MLEWIGDERRTHERVSSEVKFRCYLSGKRFQADVQTISAKGAFVALDRVVRPGASIVMELLRPGKMERAPALVAQVVHFALKPVMGAGLQWARAVSEDGLDELHSFLQEFLGLEIDVAETHRFSAREEHSQTVGYDFRSGLLSVEKRTTQSGDKIVSMFGIKVSERMMEKLGMEEVRVVQSAAPKKKRAVLHDQDAAVGEEEPVEDPAVVAKRSEEWMRLRQLGRSLEVPVVLAFEGRNLNGRTASISPKGFFVQAKERLPAPGARVLVRFPVKTEEAEVSIIIVAEVAQTLRGPRGVDWGSSMKIVTVNEGDNPGIFRRYVATV